MLNPNGQAVSVWEAEQSVPYAYDTTAKMWVGYDDVISVVDKVHKYCNCVLIMVLFP